MPRKPQVRLHAATGQFYVHIAGKRIYLGREKSSAEAQGTQLIADHLAGRQVHPGSAVVAKERSQPLFVNHLVLRYLDEFVDIRYQSKRGKLSSQVAVIKAANDVLLKYYGHTLADRFDARSLRDLQSQLVREGKLSRSTVNRYIGCVKRLFKWAESAGLVEKNTHAHLNTLEGLRKGLTKARETEKILPVPEKDLRQTIPYLPKVVAQMVRLQYWTGMRPMEICLLRPCDISMKDPVWLYVPPDHKLAHQEDARREISIGRRAQKILRRFLQRSPLEYCFSPREAEEQRLAARHKRRTTPVSCGNKPGSNRKIRRVKSPGTHYDHNSYRRAVQRACITAGVTPWAPNQLRHNLATRVREKYGVEGSQVLLGHKHIRTSEIYAEKNLKLARSIAEEFG